MGEATGTISAIADGRLISVFGRIAAAFAARLLELFRLHRRTSKSIAATGTDFAEPSDHDGQSLTPMYDNLMPLYNSDMPGMLTLVVGLD